MSDNVVQMRLVTRLPIPVETVLEGALEAGLTEVVILGFDANGDEFFASSNADGGSVLWHLMRAQKKLLQVPDDERA